ncbi:MAG TPA: hypothetical protein VNQ57_09370 [Ureibacillus sp.]|nr:hypothetical protein [Ureibacillus sp.]
MDRFGHILNLPDLQFSQFCQQQFSLNKGIYNTIDRWFFENGLIDILERRKLILQFMSFHHANETELKFGPGGLSKKLETFWRQIMRDVQIH